MRTRANYLASLQDGRDIRYKGTAVSALAEHPALGVCVGHAATAFGDAPSGVAQDDWIVNENGREFSGYYAIPRRAEDLLRRARLIEGHTRSQHAQFNIIKAVGSDALCALSALRSDLDTQTGPVRAGAAIDEFTRRCQDDDLATVVAQTDPKGDRALRPGQQRNQSAYLRVVDRTSDGLVVRGAKVHTTSAPVADEIIVLPTRAMVPGEEDYAVSFAIPTNARGLRMICRPVREELDPFDNPVSSRAYETECTTLFDDVLVPWDRVFLDGDVAQAGDLARTFATFHRFTGLSYKPPLAELLLGTVSWIVRDNGLDRKATVRGKLAEMLNYVVLIKAARTASAINGRLLPSGGFMPDPVLTNAGKHFFASNFHRLCQLTHDLAGGLAVTAPSVFDLADPQDGPWLEDVFEGATGDARRRIVAFNIVRDLTASELGGYNYVASLHGEGSMSAQLLASMEDFDMAAVESQMTALADEVLRDERLPAAAADLAG